MRRKDQTLFPEEHLLALVRKARETGTVKLTFYSPRDAYRFRVLWYQWRRMLRAVDYRTVDPDLVDTIETLCVVVQGPHVTLSGAPWDWIDAALVDGRPLRDLYKDPQKVDPEA